MKPGICIALLLLLLLAAVIATENKWPPHTVASARCNCLPAKAQKPAPDRMVSLLAMLSKY